jgi:hypothetical protein
MINDLIFTAGSFVFLIALMPSIFTENKPNTKTSLTTSIILFVFTYNYIDLNLYFSAAVGFLTGVAWLVLYFQARRIKRINESNFST